VDFPVKWPGGRFIAFTQILPPVLFFRIHKNFSFFPNLPVNQSHLRRPTPEVVHLEPPASPAGENTPAAQKSPTKDKKCDKYSTVGSGRCYQTILKIFTSGDPRRRLFI
jgi:hypothetical protein